MPQNHDGQELLDSGKGGADRYERRKPSHDISPKWWACHSVGDELVSAAATWISSMTRSRSIPRASCDSRAAPVSRLNRREANGSSTRLRRLVSTQGVGAGKGWLSVLPRNKLIGSEHARAFTMRSSGKIALEEIWRAKRVAR